MYVVIVGAGRIGGSVARWLVSAEHEVAIVDTDEGRSAALEDELGSVSVVGDGTEVSVLVRAGTNRADIFIAATGKDDHNLVACQLAMHHFGIGRAISLVNIPDHERLFNLLGVELTTNTTDLIVAGLQRQLSGLLAEEV